MVHTGLAVLPGLAGVLLGVAVVLEDHGAGRGAGRGCQVGTDGELNPDIIVYDESVFIV